MGKKNTAVTQPTMNVNPNRIRNHDHIHAANCGHKSFVHGDHVDYLHDGHYHYVEDGQTMPCDGPNSTPKPQKEGVVLKFDPSKKNKK